MPDGSGGPVGWASVARGQRALAERVTALEAQLGSGAGQADLRRAMGRLAEAREIADDVAGRTFVAEPEEAARAISDLIRAAQMLVARAHG